MEDWIKIIVETDLIKANVINAALHAANIDTVFLNKKDSAYIFLGEYDILVRKEDQKKAQAVINEIDDRDYEADHADED
jgi:hypothetical protein